MTDPIRRLIGFEPRLPLEGAAKEESRRIEKEYRHGYMSTLREREERYEREQRQEILRQKREPLPDPYDVADERTPDDATQRERRRILQEARGEFSRASEVRLEADIYGSEETIRSYLNTGLFPTSGQTMPDGSPAGFSGVPTDFGGHPLPGAAPTRYATPATHAEPVLEEYDPRKHSAPTLPDVDSPLRADPDILDKLEAYRAAGLPVPTTRAQELTAMANNLDTDQVRPDGTIQGPGWKGAILAPDGFEITEMPIELTMPGGDIVLGPLIVPETTPEEIEQIVRGIFPDEAIIKAENFAEKRIKQGKSPFKESKDGRLQGWKPGRRDWERGGRRGY